MANPRVNPKINPRICNDIPQEWPQAPPQVNPFECFGYSLGFLGRVLYSEILETRHLGAYGLLVLAPAEGLGVLRAPCQMGVILSFCILVSFFCIFCLVVFLSFCLFVFLPFALFVFLPFCLFFFFFFFF